MTSHSSIVWRIPWTEKPGGLQSMGSQRIRYNWATNIFHHLTTIFFSFHLVIYFWWESLRSTQQTSSTQCFLALLLSRVCLCNPMDYSLPSSSVHGILQARILESVAVSYFRGSSWPRNQTHISCVACIGSRFFFNHCATWEAPSIQYIVVKSCPTLCNPTNCSISGFPDRHYLPDY